jgi:Fe-S-cluster-containing dehydrogenase component
LGNRAIVRRADGILYVDQNRCIGCQHCVPACPYKTMFFNPDTRKAEKCHFCMHRIDAGLLPACVTTCLGITRDFGPYSEIVARHPRSEMMGRDVAILYENLGDVPPPSSSTAGYPAADECHR